MTVFSKKTFKKDVILHIPIYCGPAIPNLFLCCTPRSNGRGVPAPTVRPEEAAAEQTDAADTAVGARGPQRSKPAGALSGNSLAPELASDEYAGELVVANSQTPQIPQVLQIPQSPQITRKKRSAKPSVEGDE